MLNLLHTNQPSVTVPVHPPSLASACAGPCETRGYQTTVPADEGPRGRGTYSAGCARTCADSKGGGGLAAPPADGILFHPPIGKPTWTPLDITSKLAFQQLGVVPTKPPLKLLAGYGLDEDDYRRRCGRKKFKRETKTKVRESDIERCWQKKVLLISIKSDSCRLHDLTYEYEKVDLVPFLATGYTTYPSMRGTSRSIRRTTCSLASRSREERSSKARGTPTPTPSAAATSNNTPSASHCLQSSSTVLSTVPADDWDALRASVVTSPLGNFLSKQGLREEFLAMHPEVSAWNARSSRFFYDAVDPERGQTQPLEDK
uniref:Uncharacterized protein n=1 Tax=Timema bartmani TaxID=61472 RepID=A0A7R9I1A4_9NEOP|nr:unnamed protein product [Timema bartmani]